jgi:hypothetical protein
MGEKEWDPSDLFDVFGDALADRAEPGYRDGTPLEFSESLEMPPFPVPLSPPPLVKPAGKGKHESDRVFGHIRDMNPRGVRDDDSVFFKRCHGEMVNARGGTCEQLKVLCLINEFRGDFETRRDVGLLNILSFFLGRSGKFDGRLGESVLEGGLVAFG